MQYRLILSTIFVSLCWLSGCNVDWAALIDDSLPTHPAGPRAPTMPQPEDTWTQPSRPQHREFDVRQDGFSFQNYTDQANAYDLDAANVERLCGPNVCSRGRGRYCVLTGSMRTFMDAVNDGMSGGHCEGMSVLAQAILNGTIPLSRFDRNAATTYSLSFYNQALQREIAFWHATQNTFPGIMEFNPEPNKILQMLEQDARAYSLGIYKYDFFTQKKTAGHSLLPVKVHRDPRGRYDWIEVYDPNYPGNQQRFIRVERSTNTWVYDDFVGNADSQSLALSRFSDRILSQKCPPEGDLSEFHISEQEWQAWLNGDGSLRVPKGTNSYARRANKFQDMEPIYVFKTGKEVDLQIVGENFFGENSTSLVIFKQGQSVALEGIVLDPDERENIKIGKRGDSITYSTKDSESITARLGFTYVGADYELKLYPAEKQGGYTLKLRNKVDSKNKGHQLFLRIDSKTKPSTTFTVEITRIDDVKDTQFTHLKEEIPVFNNETIVLDYGKWVQDGRPLSIHRDTDSDGDIEVSQQISDDQ